MRCNWPRATRPRTSSSVRPHANSSSRESTPYASAARFATSVSFRRAWRPVDAHTRAASQRPRRGTPRGCDESGQEVAHERQRLLALLDLRDVAAALEDLHARAVDPLAELLGVDGRDERVLRAPDHER